MTEREQELLALVLDRIAESFGDRAVLRGGMVLRILGSPRFTNDLDYVFVPYESKKDIVPEILACLEGIEGAKVRHSLNSKCLRAVLTRGETTVQVEAKAALAEKSEAASTRLFSRQFGLAPRVIPVVGHPVSLADNLAAWNERRLVRDLYDVWFFLQMGVLPDIERLEARLRKPQHSRLVKPKDRFRGNTAEEFFGFLREHAAKLTDDEIRESLADYLPPEEMVGLAMQIRSALAKLRGGAEDENHGKE
jgi:predicted nucleotidyltransferase component of viral defense system